MSKLGGGIVDKVLTTQHEDQSWIPQYPHESQGEQDISAVIPELGAEGIPGASWLKQFGQQAWGSVWPCLVKWCGKWLRKDTWCQPLTSTCMGTRACAPKYMWTCIHMHIPHIHTKRIFKVWQQLNEATGNSNCCRECKPEHVACIWTQAVHLQTLTKRYWHPQRRMCKNMESVFRKAPIRKQPWSLWMSTVTHSYTNALSAGWVNNTAEKLHIWSESLRYWLGRGS